MERALKPLVTKELAIYEHLTAIQGSVVPVCCGSIGLHNSYFFDGVPLDYFLITSYAGRSVASIGRELSSDRMLGLEERMATAFDQFRLSGVVHGDEAARNVVYDEASDQLMIIDFDKSSIVNKRAPLAELSPNRKRGAECAVQSPKRMAHDLRAQSTPN